MANYERGDTSIYYEVHGDGFPLLVLAPGGLNSTIDFWQRMPINPVELFAADYKVVAMDQRNAGRSSGPLPTDDPWGAYADDQLGLMDHLNIDRFLVVGSCIACSFILKLIQKQPQRVVAGVMMQPIGTDDTNRGFFAPRVYEQWGQDLVARRPEISMDHVNEFGRAMWDTQPNFVFSVPKEFLPTVQTPLLVLPGYDQAHPTGLGLEVASLLRNSEVLENWQEPAEVVPNTIHVMLRFLRAHTPAGVA